MAYEFSIRPPSSLYLTDPQRTELGKRILAGGIELVNGIGLKEFTFRKLSQEIGSPEASIYRYFSGKEQFLCYLGSWYWKWLHLLIERESAGERYPTQKLRAAIRVLAHPRSEQYGVAYIDQRVLHQIMVAEGAKVYRTALVGQGNLRGYFLGYQELTEQIAYLLKAVNPGFAHPRALASSIFEMAHDHLFFAKHLPRLTDIEHTEEDGEELEKMLWSWVSKLLDRTVGTDELDGFRSPFTVFISRRISQESPLRKWAARTGNLISGHSFLRFEPVAFSAPKNTDWWFFYSSQAVKHCLSVHQPPPTTRLAAMGEGTAKTLRTLAGRVDFVGQGPPGKVAEQFKVVATGKRVFFPRASNSYLTIQHLLADHIVALDAVCYSNDPVPAEKPIKTDVFIFTSPLNVAAYLDYYGLPKTAHVFAIGGTTAAALYQRGYVAAFPRFPSEAGLVELLEETYRNF